MKIAVNSQKSKSYRKQNHSPNFKEVACGQKIFHNVNNNPNYLNTGLLRLAGLEMVD